MRSARELRGRGRERYDSAAARRRAQHRLVDGAGCGRARAAARRPRRARGRPQGAAADRAAPAAAAAGGAAPAGATGRAGIRPLYETLADHGWDVRLVESPGGHDWPTWRLTLEPHLGDLLRRAVRSRTWWASSSAPRTTGRRRSRR